MVSCITFMDPPSSLWPDPGDVNGDEPVGLTGPSCTFQQTRVVALLGGQADESNLTQIHKKIKENWSLSWLNGSVLIPTVDCKTTNVEHLTERAAIKLLLTDTGGQFSAPLQAVKTGL